MADQYTYDFSTPVTSGASATPATPATNPFWTALANVTPSWFPQVVNPEAQRLQREQEARLRALQQQQIQQEQQIATLQASGQYPINTGETAQGKPPVYLDPSTGGTSPNKADPNRIIQQDTKLAETTPNVEPFTFNYASAQDAAYKALQNFYDKLLAFSGGRVDIAKRTLEYIYQQGNREAIQEHEQAIAEQQIVFPKETQELLTSLNKRGVISSGFGDVDKTSLQKSQDVRRLAVDRAKENRLTRLQTERNLDLEKTNLSAEEEKFNLERQRRQEAKGMAQDEYGIKSAEYNAQLDKQLQEEQRAANKSASNTILNALGKGTGTTSTAGSSGFSSADVNRFRSWAQTTGRQQELDKATAGSTQQGADFYALMKKYRGMY